MAKAATAFSFKYSTVAGFSLQDDPDTEASTFDYKALNLGLVDQDYDTDEEYDPDHVKTQWQRFQSKVSHLNRNSANNIQYKVFYMGRHGQGVHNVAEKKDGRRAWDDYWSKLDGDGILSWSDAHLTEQGKSEALQANAFWAHEIVTQKIPVPETYCTSPLDRCITTANLTFNGLPLPAERPFVAEVKELLREVIGEHTCDWRSSKSFIQESFPSVTFEPGFTEQDELWRPDVRDEQRADCTSQEALR